MSAPALPPKAFLDACRSLTTRLTVLKRFQFQARERGETTIELAVGELFDASDEAALESFERELASLLGQQPLPYEAVS